MKIVGIIPARKGSKRLLNKNLLTVPDGRSFVKKAIDTLEASKKINSVWVATDYDADRIGYHNIIRRPDFLNGDAASVVDVVEFSLKLFHDVTHCVVLFPTNPLISTLQVDMAIENLLERNNSILRSYDYLQRENGLYIFDIERVKANKHRLYDTHTGMVTLPGIEIHTQKEYEIYRSKV